MVKNSVLKKVFFIALITILINLTIATPIYAMSNVISSGKEFLTKGQLVDDVIDTTALRETSTFIYNMFFVVAVVVAVGVGTVLGIKFITASVEGQAKIKEAVVPYVVGCVVIFSAFPIWSFIVDKGQETTKTDTSDEGDINIYYLHDSNYFGECEELFLTKKEIKESADEYETIRRQCNKCMAITVFDTKNYTAKKLEWGECTWESCNNKLAFKLEMLRQYEIGDGTSFRAKCGRCGTEDIYQYVNDGYSIRIIRAPHSYEPTGIRQNVCLKEWWSTGIAN